MRRQPFRRQSSSHDRHGIMMLLLLLLMMMMMMMMIMMIMMIMMMTPILYVYHTLYSILLSGSLRLTVDTRSVT